MKSKILLAALAFGALFAPSRTNAAVTPYSWIRLGEGGSVFADSSGQNRAFNAGFSSNPGTFGGDPGAVILPTAVGGPLGGTNGPVSTLSARFGFYNRQNGGMWMQGPNNTPPTAAQWSLPASNWVVEAWVMPADGRATGEILNTGTAQFGATPGGIAFRTRLDDATGEHMVRLDSIGPSADNRFMIGDEVLLPRTRFTHLAAVNDAGRVTFYVNGVATGAPATTGLTPPGGTPYIGSGQDTGNPFWGFIDEVRYSTFEPGAFQLADLLLLPPGPTIIAHPQSITVWDGAPAIFEVTTPVDDRTTFAWKVGGTAINDATAAEYIIPAVSTADSGKVYTVTLTNSGIDKTSDPATLLVAPVATENNAFFRSSITSEPSLLAYFPIDNDSGDPITNIEDPAHNGSIAGTPVDFDGRTNRAYGVKSLRFKGAGMVTIPPNAAYEFADGTGTIEAVIYLAPGAPSPAPQNIFAISAGDDASVYQFQVSADGNSLMYRSDVTTGGVTWVVTPSLLNRLAHVALVFNGANVTAFVDGLSLGAKPNLGRGTSTGWSATIGGAANFEGTLVGGFNGNIDELAIYGDALSDTAIAVHNSRFIYGTAVSAPTITSSPSGTISVLAGGAPQFRVVATGTAPLAYQWNRNGTPIAGSPTATTATLTILNSTVDSSGEYTVTVSNPQGSVTSPAFTVNFQPVPAGDAYAAKVLASHPSAYYRLNETSGPTLVDSAGGLNGTFGEGVGFGRPGAPGTSGGAVRIPPAGITSVPYTPALNPAGAYSIEFWAQPEVSGNIQGAIVGTQNRNTGRAGYAVYQGFNVAAWEAHLGYQDSVIFLQGTTAPTAGRWDHVVVTWDGVSASRLYVNGVLEGSSDLSPTRPNLAQPFEIGSRFNGSAHYRGVVDEVAFYNLALTPEDVTNHFSVAWVPAAITNQPPSLTATEAGSITLTVAAAGYPNRYEWYKDGVLLEAVANPDGSAHYTGINSPSLTINQIAPEDAGQYHVKILNPTGDIQSAVSSLTFARDVAPPTVASVTGDASLRRVRVTFNKPVTLDTALVPGNYVFTGGLTAASVSETIDPSVVNVVLASPMTPGAQYSLTVNNVIDTRLEGNTIGANATTFNAFVLTQGVLAVDIYRGLGPGQPVDFRDFPPYPDGVSSNMTLTSFATPDLGIDRYGAHYYGWITPATNGNYTFFIRSDDGSELWISNNDDPAGVELIAYELGCCQGFLEPTQDPAPTQTSTPRALVAGQRYYIEAFLKEDGGGDFLQVAWRMGDEPAASTLTPIPAQFLSAYAAASRPELTAVAGAAGGVTISWTGAGKLQESTDLSTWTDVPGNPASGYNANATAASFKFYRIAQ